MKKTLSDTGAIEKEKIDYFEIARTSIPTEAYGIQEFQKKIVAERTKKQRKQDPKANS